jgi:tRNA threonylcarbamoyladenosine biosynthesis protein TsaB
VIESYMTDPATEQDTSKWLTKVMYFTTADSTGKNSTPSMPNILLVETATEVCSVAVFSENRIIALSENQHCTNHAAELTLLVSECMKKAFLNFADLDAVAVSGGPGAYTSLRVGASVAKGLCYALDKPLVVFDTLLALAAAARKMTDTRKLLLLPALDARRQEVWMALV